MGPGVPGLEHDPPLYHFDLSEEEFSQMLIDPVEFLRMLGLGPEQNVAMDGVVNVQLPNPTQAWSGNGWQPVDRVRKKRWCCELVAQTLLCHWHN